MTDRYRNPAPAIPFIFLHGTEDLEITTTPTAMTWDHAHFVTSDLSFISGGTRITVNRGGEGIYMIHVNGGVSDKTGRPTYCGFTIYKNGVAQACCSGHAIVGDPEHSDVALISSLYLKIDDYIEIYAWVDDGTGNLEPGTARLIMQGLSMKGWDNSHGGKLRVRGGVSR